MRGCGNGSKGRLEDQEFSQDPRHSRAPLGREEAPGVASAIPGPTRAPALANLSYRLVSELHTLLPRFYTKKQRLRSENLWVRGYPGLTPSLMVPPLGHSDWLWERHVILSKANQS